MPSTNKAPLTTIPSFVYVNSVLSFLEQVDEDVSWIVLQEMEGSQVYTEAWIW